MTEMSPRSVEHKMHTMNCSLPHGESYDPDVEAKLAKYDTNGECSLSCPVNHDPDVSVKRPTLHYTHYECSLSREVDYITQILLRRVQNTTHTTHILYSAR